MRHILIAFAAISTVTGVHAASQRPNILFIYSDDHGPWAMGVAGNPNAESPNLDKLVNSGAYLVNAFTVTPVCSPSRASLMTSRYGSEVAITDWLNPSREPDRGLDPATPSWPKLLQAAGYHTGLVGKWHLGLNDEFHPTVFGYDHFFGFRGGGNTPKDPKLEQNREVQTFKGWTPDVLTDDAIAFLQGHQKNQSTQPFCLCMHYRAPHAAWLPLPDSDWDPFKDLDPTLPEPDFPKLDVPKVKRVTREYLGSVHSVDRNVGRLMQTLDALQLTGNTVVIYSSDHGYNMGHHGIWHKGNGHWILTDPPAGQPNVPRGQRPNMYDTSIRVPCAIRWPGVTQPGTRLTETHVNLDWFPTLLEIAGVPIPKGTLLRGESYVPVLRSTAVDWNNDYYGEYSTHHQSKTHMRTYRTPQWKLLRDFRNPGRDELYDLTSDPAETTNLIASTEPHIQKIISDLNERIIQQMEMIGDPILGEVRTTGKAVSPMPSGL